MQIKTRIAASLIALHWLALNRAEVRGLWT